MNYQTIFTFISILSAPFLASCGHFGKGAKTELELIHDQVVATQSAHGIEAWWQKELVQAEVEMIFQGNLIVDGTFTFEANGPKSRYDRKRGGSIIYDGKTAWMLDPAAPENNARFHVLTWPWFIMAPFKMEGEGITLSEFNTVKFNGKKHHLIKQSFASDMGDAPDDWYRFIISAKTDYINAMTYIVTYNKDVEEANSKPSIIKYMDYKDFDGTLISTVYEFWYWDKEKFEVVGDSPKGFGRVSDVRYISKDSEIFQIPESAVELKLPE